MRFDEVGKAPRALVTGVVCLAGALLIATGSLGQSGAPNGEWPHFGGDLGNTKYSALDQINKDNFHTLQIAWSWADISPQIVAANPQVRAGQFKPTPLKVGDYLYVVTAVGQVAALEAATGKTSWSFDTEAWKAGRPANVGFQHRGGALWRGRGERQQPLLRFFVATHDRKLWALDALTGEPIGDFGKGEHSPGGYADLEHNLDREFNPRWVTHTSPPLVCGDTVVVGSIIHDGPSHKSAPPGHVRGFDARTGHLKWIFHTIPQPGEAGNDTWENESWAYSGAANVWTMMTADEDLGLVYLPTSTPTNDWYGGHRLGDNLFAESLVALDCDSGKRAWHFQAVHHGLWDYDFPTNPVLFDLEENGSVFRGIAAPSKQAFLYVFDRRTGAPRWPIEERPVPQSNVPGERTSPTQPFPTKPAPFDRQGVTVDDLIDFTPELRSEAQKILGRYTYGPIFTPPVVLGDTFGTLTVPAPSGGANWPGAAYDPDSKRIFIPSITEVMVSTLIEADPARTDFRYMLRGFAVASGPQGLPLLKPPYGRITAIDLRSGDHAWMTPHGDGPRHHPAIEHLGLGPLGTHGSGAIGGGGPLTTKTLLVVGHGTSPGDEGDDAIPKLSFFDKATGDFLGFIALPANPYGNPITYMQAGKQYLAVAVGGGTIFGGGGTPGQIIALALP